MVRRAERLFGTDPDSTVRLIDSVLRMPAYFEEGKRMDIAMLQAEALFGDRDDREISPLMDDEFFDDKPFLTTSPELERAADYYARKKKYDKAAHAALYSGFVQQHYGEKTHAMQSFKDAERYGGMVKDSLTMAWAEYNISKMLIDDGIYLEALAMLNNADLYYGSFLDGKALVQNMIAVCNLLLGDNEKARIHLQQSLIYAKTGKVNKVKCKALNNLAVLYQLQGEYDNAITCLRDIANEPNLDKTKLLLFYMNMGDVFLEIPEMDSASLYFKRVDSLLPFANVKIETKASAYNSLSQFAEYKNNDSLALFYWKHYDKWLNEARDRLEQNNVYGIQKKYDYGTMQNVLNQKVIRRQRIIIALSVVAALVFLAFAISQIRLARIRRNEAEIKASLLHFMKQNEELAKQSEAVKKAHLDLQQKHQEIEESHQNLASQVEEYKTAFEASDKKLSKALQKEHQIMQKMAVLLENENDKALLDALKHSVLGNQEYWAAMLKTFDRQFPGIRKELALQHPELTDIEQKILLLSYVDASREDTAVLLGISVFMVDKLRTSVKKKMASNASNAFQKP